MAPKQFRASDAGLYTLRGGPLCGLYTDQLPLAGRRCIGLVADNRPGGGREWMCVYRFEPDRLSYRFLGARAIVQGE